MRTDLKRKSASIILIILIIGLFFLEACTTNTANTREDEVFLIVEEMPEFPGGERAFRQWIAKNINHPADAVERGIEGRVYIQFVVDTDGSVTNARVVRGVDPSLDQEALRVINRQPKWKSGKQRGKRVKVSYTIPINFRLQ